MGIYRASNVFSAGNDSFLAGPRRHLIEFFRGSLVNQIDKLNLGKLTYCCCIYYKHFSGYLNITFSVPPFSVQININTTVSIT